MPKINKSDKFLKLINKHKEAKKVEKFDGTLTEYLKILEEDTSPTKLAHKRLYDAITGHGITRMKKSDER
jgi:predicted Ser/Thr protein kinase